MNIGYVYGFDSHPCKGGGAIHVHNLITELTELGCKIHTFTPESNPRCKIYNQDKAGVDKFISNIDLLYIRIDGWYLSHSKLKLELMDQFKPKPIVWEINSSAEEMIFRNHQSILKNKFSILKKIKAYRKLRRVKKDVRKDEEFRCLYAKNVSSACCVSSALAEYAKRKLKISSCNVIPNGSNPIFFSPEKKNDHVYNDCPEHFKVLYAGDSRWPWQGFPIITKLANYALKHDQQILFIILDNSPDPKPMNQDNLRLISQVPYSNVPEYIASADVCLCIYDDFKWSSLGFHLSPLKLFDYLSCGKPVIGSNFGQISEIIEDGENGFLTSNNVEEIYQKIKFLKDNKQSLKRMGSIAREKVKSQLSWHHTAQQTYKVFSDLI